MKSRALLMALVLLCSCTPLAEARPRAALSAVATSYVFVDITDSEGAIIRDANGGFVELQRLIEEEWHGYQSNLMSGGSQQFSMRHPGTYRVVWFAGGTTWRDNATGADQAASDPFPNGVDQRITFILERTAATSIPSPTLTTWPTLTRRPSRTPTRVVPTTLMPPIVGTTTPAPQATAAPPTLSAWQHIAIAERLLIEQYPWLDRIHLMVEMDSTLFPEKE